MRASTIARLSPGVCLSGFVLPVLMLVVWAPTLLAQQDHVQGVVVPIFSTVQPPPLPIYIREQPLPPPQAELLPPAQRARPLDALEPPPRLEVFRALSEADFLNRLRAESRQQNEPFVTPKESPLREELNLREPPPAAAVFAARNVCHRPLYFEQWRAERYGWRLPPAHPLVSAGIFYIDAALWPGKLILRPPWRLVCDLDARPPFEDPLATQRGLPRYWADAHWRAPRDCCDDVGNEFDGPITFRCEIIDDERSSAQMHGRSVSSLEVAPVVVENPR